MSTNRLPRGGVDAHEHGCGAGIPFSDRASLPGRARPYWLDTEAILKLPF